ncbi:transposase [Streptomyces sp. NPDC091280]|uniref:transposase n=1 Tax=Streptomyces sp. NPDC091280 TaxID=3365984 RepID=UPI0038106058
MARFTNSQCRPCPACTQCTSTADNAPTVGFPPRELRDLQLRIRTEQQTSEWKARYAVRFGEEAPTPARPTAFQTYLDQRELRQPKPWRTLGT